jgi:hypothetical protein
MGLSEDEKRALEELEKSLYADDPKFVAKAARPVPATTVVAGVLLAVIGISLMVFSAIIQLVVFGVVGFAVMLAGVLMATPTRGIADRPRKSNSASTPKPKPSGGKSFFEDRWDKRG